MFKVPSAIKVVCFVYQHPYTDTKNENVQNQLDEKREMGKHPYELQWSEQLLPPPPRSKEDMAWLERG